MADSWRPDIYLQFDDERTRAARDLLAQVPLVEPSRIVDVGCGPGNSTALLAARYPASAIVGLDSSAAMLSRARAALPGVRFEEADATTWLPEAQTTLVFANAVYQWVPNHLALFPQVLRALAPGAVLAVQMPDNLAEPTHRLMQAVAEDSRWSARLRHAARDPLPPVATYYDALRPACSHLDIWHIVYNHVLDGADAIVEWVRGTGLRPFLDPLTEGERADFLARYRARIAEAYPPTREGKVLLRFPRLFIVAQR
jgi:trans-aconitate 2-methyltransferase